MVIERPKRLPAIILMSLLLGLGLAAQDATNVASPPFQAADLKLMVFSARAIDEMSGGDESNPSLNQALSGILRSRASQTGFTLVDAPDWQSIGSQQSQDGAEQGDPILASARAGEVQATLSLVWFQEGRRITLIAKIYDAWEGRLVAGSTLTGLDDVSLLNTTDTLVGSLLDKLAAEAESIAANYGSGGPGTMSRELVLKCPTEGATISLAGGEVLGVITKGELRLPFRPLALNQGIELRMEKPGFYPRTVTLLVKGVRPELQLPELYPKTNFTVLVSANPDMFYGNTNAGSNGTPTPAWLKLGVGLDLRWFPIPDTWFVQADYLLNLADNPTSPAELVAAPFIMHQVSVETAVAVLTPAEWPVRLFAGLGFGSYFSASNANAALVYVDPFLQLPYLNFQFNLQGLIHALPLVVEVEAGAIFVFASGANLLPSGLVKSFGLTRLSLGWKW